MMHRIPNGTRITRRIPQYGILLNQREKLQNNISDIADQT